jgi:hypothetical protein
MLTMMTDDGQCDGDADDCHNDDNDYFRVLTNNDSDNVHCNNTKITLLNIR